MPVRSLPDGRVPVLLSAHQQELIGRDAAAILDYLDRRPGVAVPAVAAALLRTRRVRRHRAVLRAGNPAELRSGLRALVVGAEHPLVVRSSVAAAPVVTFVCPGQGSQWPSMGADAYEKLPAYRVEADRCAHAFAAAGHPSPRHYLLTGGERCWSQVDIQGAQFTHSVSLGQVWRRCGIVPAITLGHSLGEVAAAYLAGSVSLTDAVAVVVARATVAEQLAGCAGYGMAVLGAGVDETHRRIGEIDGWLEVSAVNGPESTVVSGDREAITRIVGLLEQRGIFAREIPVDYPGHSSALEPLRDTFDNLLGQLLPGGPASMFADAPVEFVSSVRATVVGSGVKFGEYWWQNLRDTVEFGRAVGTAIGLGAGAFVELSAQPSLLSALCDLVDDDTGVIVGSGSREEAVADQLSANVAAVAVADPVHRWGDMVDITDQPLLPGFPNAPMQAIRLWATPEPAVTVATEHWVATSAPRASVTTCGVAVLGSDEDFTVRLTEAIGVHPGCRLVPAQDAEIVVLLSAALMHPAAVVAADEITRRPGGGLPDYAAVIGTRCQRVWLLTTGGEQVRPEDPVALPGQAALTAMHRSVGFEFPDQTFYHLDLPRRDIDAETASACIDVLLGDDTDIALRANGTGELTCYRRTLRECCEPEFHRPPDPAALDNVVITGGNGAIGRRFARYCIERGARRVILLSRGGVGPGSLSRLTAGAAVDVRAPACDITDPRALAAVAAEHAGDGASLLIHTAGVARFSTHTGLDGDDLAEMFGAKVAGPARMVETWPLRPDTRILLCSSVSGVWGGYGHAGYAASNRLLDIYADRLRTAGWDCTSVRWGLWPDAGIAGPDEISRIERSGLLAMDPGAALRAGLRRYHENPLIFSFDTERLRVFLEDQGIPMVFAVDGGIGRHEDDGDYDEPRPVAELVRAALAAALSLPDPGAVDLDKALVDLGMDSLLALDLRNRLRRSTGRTPPVSRLLGGISGAELIDALHVEPEREGMASVSD
jgi:mycobactin polyketide synthetase MbtD